MADLADNKMTVNETITHPGVVEEVEDAKVFVKILSQSACSSCHAKGMCSVAEVEEKTVEVVSAEGRNYKPGDHVTVRMEKSLGKKAVFLGYLLPFILLMATLILMISLTSNEGLSAIVSLLILGPYYLLLYLLKDRLSRQFRFRID